VSGDGISVILAQLVVLFEIDETEYAMRVVVGEMVVFAFWGGGGGAQELGGPTWGKRRTDNPPRLLLLIRS
jgi:hypothetical protein